MNFEFKLNKEEKCRGINTVFTEDLSVYKSGGDTSFSINDKYRHVGSAFSAH